MIKKLVLEMLDYLRFQVENDKCTKEELRSIYSALTNGIHVDATIKDIAEHYGQSGSNVRNAIARGYTGKPKRGVYYNMVEFVKRMPKSWSSNM